MENKPRSFVSLSKEFLSLPGETLPDFAAGLKKLTEKDRADLRSEFEKMGFTLIPEGGV